jgi:adenylosuccinate synthase
MRPWVADVSVALTKAMAGGRSILFEGAQGTMLDLDHGTYPYVTSSNATVGGACTGLGVGPRSVHAVLGIAKAYTTRVGEGPFPTELHGAEGDKLRAKGHEFGAVTGRPRRCGWFDAVQVRHAVRVNGLDAVVITKLDVLDGLAEVPVCVGYRVDGEVCEEFPADLRRLQRCAPIVESMPGWSAPTGGVKRFVDLPPAAGAYIERLEQLIGVPALLISTGSGRDDTIVRNEPLAAAWLGSALP